uniref:T4.4 protein n=1 Tax=Malus x robusta TaxID=1184610 RepID=I7J3I3_9ROSA|nr:T4.4 [Malus x robusta]
MKCRLETGSPPEPDDRSLLSNLSELLKFNLTATNNNCSR